MNPSTQRAVPGIQAGRQRETNDKGRQMNPSTQTGSSRLGDNGRQMKGDKGRQVNKRTRPPREPCQASRRGDNGRQRKGDTGRQMNPSTQRAVPGIQARAWQQASRRATLNEFRTPHSKLLGEKQKTSLRAIPTLHTHELTTVTTNSAAS